METRLLEKIDAVKKPTYTEMTNKQLGTNIKKIVKHIDQERKESSAEEINERQKRTIIVKQYKDKNVRNSEDVRKPIYEQFPGTIIRNARTTAGGSILVELDDEKSAENITKNWNRHLYGGNQGVMMGNIPKTIGIVKHVWIQRPLEEIKEDIIENYHCKEVEFFKKNGNYMGIVKITFNTQDELEKTMNERIKIFRQRFIVEEYNFKPRVIKCNQCQKFNHIARLCRSDELCGKCGRNHNTDTCNVDPEDYTCHHCKGNHQTGDKECPVMKEKEEFLKNRHQNV